jgi:hypothetical protein
MRMNLPGFTAYVHNPRQMRLYTAKVLSDAQLADLFAYIKSLGIAAGEAHSVVDAHHQPEPEVIGSPFGIRSSRSSRIMTTIDISESTLQNGPKAVWVC